MDNEEQLISLKEQLEAERNAHSETKTKLQERLEESEKSLHEVQEALEVEQGAHAKSKTKLINELEIQYDKSLNKVQETIEAVQATHAKFKTNFVNELEEAHAETEQKLVNISQALRDEKSKNEDILKRLDESETQVCFFPIWWVNHSCTLHYYLASQGFTNGADTGNL